MSIYKPPKAGDNRILIVGPNWIGDMVLAQSLLLFLKRHMPDAVIDVLGPSWSIGILARMPQVPRSILLPNLHHKLDWQVRWRLAKQLRHQYDKAYVLPRSLKAALVPFLARIAHRIGFTGEYRYGLLNERRHLDKTVLNQTVKRYVSLGYAKSDAYPPPFIDRPQLSVDLENQANWLEKLSINGRPLLALLPGAEYGEAKRWPSHYFRRLALVFTQKGYTVIVLGSAKEEALGKRIADNLENVINLCGQTQLTDAIDLLAACRQVVSNDSGLMHIAAAVNVPLHAIYGSSSPQYTPPLTPYAHIHYLHLGCSPCFKRDCPLGHTHCLRWITPESLIDAINRTETLMEASTQG